MTSPPSSSEDGKRTDAPRSSAFELLDPLVQRWVWQKGWRELRDIQERAIAPILEGKRDVILSASTAAGKTEAAFMPICSRLAGEDKVGFRALYISPLKALINDQFERLEDLCKDLVIPVHRWHGDVTANRKHEAIEMPGGVLLITPESLEALLIRQGHRVAALMAQLDHVVLDELHAYVGGERGRQVQSLLHRVELLVKRRIQRIGLSATLGDFSIAATYLRPSDPAGVDVIVSAGEGQVLKVQVKGYLEVACSNGAASEGEASEADDVATYAIADHLYRTLRGQKHLVFANSRAKVEHYSDILRRRSETERVPNEFLPHHGSLSKELREEAESALKNPARPATAVCTSTLELGIDIGRVVSIAQIGAPFSVASLRQRLGRSGRRGDPAVLRVYVTERQLGKNSSILDELRPDLVQAVATIELLRERWCEPPESGAMCLSVLVQQIMSLIVQCGGINASEGWAALCKSGPFQEVDQQRFAQLLRSMGGRKLIEQSPDGTLVLGEVGERIVNHYSFYAVFQTPEEFRIVHGRHTLGTMAFDLSLVVGLHIVFAGRRWRIVEIDTDSRTVVVMPAPGGRLPRFEASKGGLVHDQVRQRMRVVYESAVTYPYLDDGAARMLMEARTNYARLGLRETVIIPCGSDVVVFLCRGDRITNTLLCMLAARGFDVFAAGPAIYLTGSAAPAVEGALRELRESVPPDPLMLAKCVRNKASSKYDWALDDDLLDREYARRAIDVAGLRASLE